MYIKKLLFANTFPHNTKKFRADADVGGNLLLRNTLDEMRIFVYEVKIALFGRHGQILDDTKLFSDVSVLHQNAEKPFKYGNLVQQNIEVAFLQLEYDCIFNRTDILHRRIACCKTVHVCYPPVVDGEHDNILITFFVKVISLQGTFMDIVNTLRYLSFPQKKVLSL